MTHRDSKNMQDDTTLETLDSHFKTFERDTSSYRVFYGLSESHKIIGIEQVELTSPINGYKHNIWKAFSRAIECMHTLFWNRSILAQVVSSQR